MTFSSRDPLHGLKSPRSEHQADAHFHEPDQPQRPDTQVENGRPEDTAVTSEQDFSGVT